jgi:hypothetical protein
MNTCSRDSLGASRFGRLYLKVSAFCTRYIDHRVALHTVEVKRNIEPLRCLCLFDVKKADQRQPEIKQLAKASSKITELKQFR